MSDMSAEEQVMQLWQQALSGRSRKERQIAAHAFAVASVSVPEKVAACLLYTSDAADDRTV